MNAIRTAIAIAGMLLGAGCASTGSDATPPPARAVATMEPTSVAQPVADSDPIVCKSAPPTGSRISKRTCMHRSEWARAQQAGRESTDDIQRHGAQETTAVQ